MSSPTRSPFDSLGSSHSQARDRREVWSEVTGTPITGGNTNSEHLVAAQALTGGRGRTSGLGGQVTRQAPTINMDVGIHRAGPTYGSSTSSQQTRDQQRQFLLSGDRSGAESLAIHGYGQQPAFQEMNTHNVMTDIEFMHSLSAPLPMIGQGGQWQNLSHDQHSAMRTMTAMIAARMGVPEDHPQVLRAAQALAERHF